MISTPHDWVFRRTTGFKQQYAALNAGQKRLAKLAFREFRRQPFQNPRLRAHKIHSLSAKMKRTIFAVRIDNDLRAVFFLDGNRIVALGIGTHAIYKAK